MISPAPHVLSLVLSVPSLSAAKTRHEPSASLMYAGPPESPKHGDLPSPPTRRPPFQSELPVWTSGSRRVVCTQRLIPNPSWFPAALAPNPATTTSAPALRTSVSHPIKMGVMGTSVTGFL